ncbi:MAG: transposase [Deltaproteobacteria bacterium]|jgi:transposase-like protein|nr:transposase [Deltaproteobacteria bacterium]
MTKKKKNYSTQFKIDAVKLTPEQVYKVTEVARSLGIHDGNLRRWKTQRKNEL